MTDAAGDAEERIVCWWQAVEVCLARRGTVPGVGRTLSDKDFTIEAVHRFHADTVTPVAADLLARHGDAPDGIVALQALHRAATGARPADEAEWTAALVPVLRTVFRHAYPYRGAYDRAHRSALHYAAANRAAIDGAFGSAAAYADHYATLNTDAAVRFFADANARAHARLCARSYATRDVLGYAATRPDVRMGALLAAAEALSPEVAAGLCDRLAHGLRAAGRGSEDVTT